MYHKGYFNGYMTEKRLLERLTLPMEQWDIKDESKERMRLGIKRGKLIHKFIETGKGDVSIIQKEVLSKFRNSLPAFGGRHEYLIDIPLDKCHMTGIVDYVHRERKIVKEFKTTAKKSYEDDNFINSYQWRVYSVGTGIDNIEYNIFSIGKEGDKCNYLPPLQLHLSQVGGRAKVLEDLNFLCEMFIKFLEKHNLTHLITPKHDKPNLRLE